MTPDPATHFRRDPYRIRADRERDDREWRSAPRGELAGPIRESDRELPSFVRGRAGLDLGHAVEVPDEYLLHPDTDPAPTQGDTE